MAEKGHEISLNDAASKYLAGLPAETAAAAGAEIKRFTGWFHGERQTSSLSPLEVAGYSDHFSASDTESPHKMEILRKFLAYLKKEGWTETNLSVHLKARKEKAAKPPQTKLTSAEQGVLTQQGYEESQKELDSLRTQRPSVLEDIRRAAADKDFRENSPLHAAREQLGHIDGRIKQLEAMLKTATIINRGEGGRAFIAPGNKVTLKALATGKEFTYTIVGPKEANPAGGKISHVSPIGRAVIGRKQGDEVEVEVPSGKTRYRIEKVE